MKIYIEVIIFINIIIDFVLLFGTCVLLRRQSNLKKLIFSSVIGGIALILMPYKIPQIFALVIKIATSLIMVIICMGYKNIKYTLQNLFYFYTLNIILGGTIYLISYEIITRYKDLSFLRNDTYLNLITILALSPLIIFAYVKKIKEIKNNYNNYYNIDIYLKNKTKASLTAYLDTGNHLTDPYKNRPIILINKDKLKFDYENILLVPYDSLNNHGLLKCIIPEKIYIDKIGVKTNFLIGISEEKISIDGVDCILHQSLIERTII